MIYRFIFSNGSSIVRVPDLTKHTLEYYICDIIDNSAIAAQIHGLEINNTGPLFAPIGSWITQLTGLRNLTITNCELHELPEPVLDILPQLELLNVSQNHIQVPLFPLHTPVATNLVSLNCSWNQELQLIGYLRAPKLQRLDCNGCGLTRLPRSLPNLDTLWCRHNQLQKSSQDIHSISRRLKYVFADEPILFTKSSVKLTKIGNISAV